MAIQMDSIRIMDADQPARTRFVRPEKCPNCGEEMEIRAYLDSATHLWIVFWQCPGNVQDDACEANGDVYGAVEEVA